MKFDIVKGSYIIFVEEECLFFGVGHAQVSDLDEATRPCFGALQSDLVAWRLELFDVGRIRVVRKEPSLKILPFFLDRRLYPGGGRG